MSSNNVIPTLKGFDSLLHHILDMERVESALKGELDLTQFNMCAKVGNQKYKILLKTLNLNSKTTFRF